MTAPRTLLAITPREHADFLPPPLFGELQKLLPALEIVDPRELDATAWAALLAARRPQLLVSGWKTPALPGDYPVGPDAADGLQYLCHLTGSVRKFVSAQQVERGLRVSNWGNSVSRVMAECGLFLAIAALRRASHWAREMPRGAWKDDGSQFHSLFERRVGLHGFGAIARELVKLMQPFGVQVQTYSPSVPDAELAACGVTRADTLAELFARNDVIVELAPLTERTRGLVDETLLRSIRPGGVFVNIGRGAVVDEDAMIRVAREGQVQFALDVFAVEPLSADSPLRNLPNVTLLPHMAGPTVDRRRDAGAFALANIRRYLAGDALHAQITPDIYARQT
ncbi:hydroxyacid dehydrogenase [Uliginosibacterium sp. H1]|uniref:hydroxyacid dehydrogenase n=1 Tax=Uliginosibacterium sp. H1 TaxID=3114757 RepID=UPI002E17FF06|nr:hydroxyacid dehydrogenase [Uliginosibacterium sp. H1]